MNGPRLQDTRTGAAANSVVMSSLLAVSASYIEAYMAGTSAHEITQLLQAWGNGDQQALDKLTPLVYEELYRTAQR